MTITNPMAHLWFAASVNSTTSKSSSCHPTRQSSTRLSHFGRWLNGVSNKNSSPKLTSKLTSQNFRCYSQRLWNQWRQRRQDVPRPPTIVTSYTTCWCRWKGLSWMIETWRRCKRWMLSKLIQFPHIQTRQTKTSIKVALRSQMLVHSSTWPTASKINRVKSPKTPTSISRHCRMFSTSSDLSVISTSKFET